MQIAGSFRLAQAISEALQEKGTAREVCHFLLELLPPLLGAQGICIELLRGRSFTERRDPLTFCSNDPPNPEATDEVVANLNVGDELLGRIRLYLPPDAPGLGLQGLAFLDFVASRLACTLHEGRKARSLLDSLTPAERRVLSLLELPTDRILATLQISRETFRVHCKRLYKKLGVHDRYEAVRVACKVGLDSGHPAREDVATPTELPS